MIDIKQGSDVLRCIGEANAVATGKPAPMSLGHFFLAIDVEAICDLEALSWCLRAFASARAVMSLNKGESRHHPAPSPSHSPPCPTLSPTASHPLCPVPNDGTGSTTPPLPLTSLSSTRVNLPTRTVRVTSRRSSRRSRATSSAGCAAPGRTPMAREGFGPRARRRTTSDRSGCPKARKKRGREGG